MPRAVTLARFRAEVLALYEPPMRARATYFKIRQVLDELAADRQIRGPRDLTPPAVARWIAAHPGRRAVTTRSLLGSLRAICGYAVAVGYLTRSPWEFRRDWVRVEPGEEHPRHHPAEAIARVLATLAIEDCGPWRAGRLRALVALVAFTGVRKMEALGLETGDVDLPGRMIRLRSNRWRRLKSAASGQPVPVAEALADVLAGWLPRTGSDLLLPNRSGAGPWTGGPPGYKPLDQVKAAGCRAGVRDLTLLSLRHSWATHAESLWGLSGPTIQRVLRHTSERTSREHYRHADLANLRETGLKIHYPEDLRDAS